MKVHYPKLYNMAHISLNVFTASKGSTMAHLSLNVFTASKGSTNYILFAVTAAGVVR